MIEMVFGKPSKELLSPLMKRIFQGSCLGYFRKYWCYSTHNSGPISVWVLPGHRVFEK